MQIRAPQVTALVLAAALAACGGGDAPAPQPTETAPASAESLPGALFVDAAPDGAQNVGEVKAAAKEGDVVTVRGRIGGKVPFVAGRAIMTIADTERLTACSDRAHDPCPEPWDYCCETPEDMVANTATVEVVGPDGRPLRAGLEGAHGLAKLGFVVVTGTVGPRPDPGVLVIDATAIHVEP